MLFKSLSAAVFGIDAYLVEVEVDVGSGNLHDFNVVGLPDVAVKESRIGQANHVEIVQRSEEHTSELQSLAYLVCRLLLEKKKKIMKRSNADDECTRYT